MPSPSTSSLSASSSSVESNTQVLHALDLPEIRQQIASNLEKADLAQCILVSQKWSSDFLPLYWREVNVRPHKLTRCSAVAIKRQGHHIRTLFAGRIEDTSVFNQPSVLHLQHLEVSTCGSRYREDNGRGCLHEIVQRNREVLRTLWWRCHGRDTLEERPYRLWVPMFESLLNLEHLTLSNWSLSRHDFVKILQSCPALKHLTFEATEEILGEEQRSSIQVHTAPSFRDYKHHGVAMLEFTGNFIPSFLQHVPNIQSLKLANLLNGDFQDTVEQLGRVHSFAELKHLMILTSCSQTSQFMALVNTITHLATFEGNVPFPVLEDFFETILQRHAQTIEYLVLTNDALQRPSFRFNIWRFLEFCPQLVTLDIPFNLRDCVAWTVSADDSSASTSIGPGLQRLITKFYEPTSEWACKDLRRLRLWIKDIDRLHPMDQITFDLCVDRLLPPDEKHNSISRARTVIERMILERLSGLKRLEELHIGVVWFTLPKRH